MNWLRDDTPQLHGPDNATGETTAERSGASSLVECSRTQSGFGNPGGVI